MAGYVMTLGQKQESINILRSCVRNGCYSTIIQPLKYRSFVYKEGTFADYFTMRPGDNIFFFCNRLIYGIGKLVSVQNECKFLNYLGADTPCNFTDEEFENANALIPDSNICNRCFCVFDGDPSFFTQGIDMDEVLASNPNAFRMLRVMDGVSFIKIGDEENQALKDIILKRNEENLILSDGENTQDNNESESIFESNDDFQTSLSERNLSNYFFRYNSLLINSTNRDGSLLREATLEAALCDILTHRDDTLFGHWDYISHQVVASPFKPVKFMDKMDIFGYRYIPGYKTKSKFLIIELKRDSADTSVIGQVMKYVDWVKEEYARGDYSMIEAYVVAHDFPETVFNERDNLAIRNYIQGFRPTRAKIWNNLRLVKYSCVDGQIMFEEAVRNE